METREVLKVEHLRKAYRGQDVLKNVTFSLESGTATALVGPAGAGKTTLFRILAGMAFPDGGSVSLFGSSGGLRGDSELQMFSIMPSSPQYISKGPSNPVLAASGVWLRA